LDHVYHKGVDQLYYPDSNTMVISGSHNINDAITDLTIPLNMLQQTKRYEEADNMYQKYKPSTIIAHSLGGAIALDIQQRYNDKKTDFQVYNVPTIRQKNFFPSNVHDYSRHGDIISVFDSAAVRDPKKYDVNPFIAHSYK